jgi:hypothetical protein
MGQRWRETLLSRPGIGSEARNSNAKVDYVLQAGSRIVPIEVKAGASGSLRSLHQLISEKTLDLGVRVSSQPQLLQEVASAVPGEQQRTFQLLSIPFYLVAELPRLLREIQLRS